MASKEVFGEESSSSDSSEESSSEEEAQQEQQEVVRLPFEKEAPSSALYLEFFISAGWGPGTVFFK